MSQKSTQHTRDKSLVSSTRSDWRLTAEQRRDARRAFELADGSGMTLEACVRLALRISGDPTDTALNKAIDAFLEDCNKREIRESTAGFYETKLMQFSSSWPDGTMGSVKRSDLKRWIEAMPCAAETMRGYLGAVRRLYRWSKVQEPPLCSADPTEGLVLSIPSPKRDVGYLEPAEAAEIMQHAGPYTAALALMLFAGIRVLEVNGTGKRPVEWGDIDMKGRIIRIDADTAKTRSGRIIEDAPENLWAWLETVPARERRDTVCPVPGTQVIRYVQIKAGYLDSSKRRVKPWPKGATRHSFATYHVALHADPGKTALILGHEGGLTMLYRHYRGLATRAEAERYFAITPPT